MTWFRLPIFVWTLYATSFIFLLAVPVLAMALILVVVERLLAHRHLRSGAGRRSAAVPAPVLVLFAPGRLHHDPAGHGHRQRSHSLLRPQEAVRLHVRRLLPASASPAWAFWSGRITCSWPASRCMRRMIFSLPELPGGGALGDQGLQLDGHALQGLDLLRSADAVCAGLRRACSRSAA